MDTEAITTDENDIKEADSASTCLWVDGKVKSVGRSMMFLTQQEPIRDRVDAVAITSGGRVKQRGSHVCGSGENGKKKKGRVTG